MNARERLLVALDGGEPDRVPRALGFSHVNVHEVVPQGWRWAGDDRLDPVVDVRFVRFPPSAEDEALRRLARPFSPDTRLGTPAQAATYATWRYCPLEPDQRNPLARAESLEDLRAFPFPKSAALADQTQGILNIASNRINSVALSINSIYKEF